LLDDMSDAAVESSRTEIFDGKFNTYVFTKSVLECMMDEEKDNLPICIVRPSIVGPVYREPHPGWLNSDHGYVLPSTLFTRGMARTGYLRGDIKFDVVAVDFLASIVLAAAWEIGVSENKTMRLYNFCSSSRNPVTPEFGVKVINKMIVEFPMSDCVWYPHATITSSRILVNFLEFFQLVIPACALDVTRYVMGKKPKFLKFFKYYIKLRDALEYFRTNEWNFQTENMMKLYNQMSPRDQDTFNFRVENIDWKNYIYIGYAFMREHILKQDSTSLEKARTRMKILTFAHRSFQIFGSAFVAFVLMYFIRVIFGLN